tara:strand:- start:373 stop:606 length:234 start_codon:yes stop_codon:yes gene_type:complete
MCPKKFTTQKLAQILTIKYGSTSNWRTSWAGHHKSIHKLPTTISFRILGASPETSRFDLLEGKGISGDHLFALSKKV